MIQIKSFSISLFIVLLLLLANTTVFAATGTCTTATHPVSRAPKVLAEIVVKKEKKIKTTRERFAAARVFRSKSYWFKNLNYEVSVWLMCISMLLVVLVPTMLVVLVPLGILIALAGGGYFLLWLSLGLLVLPLATFLLIPVVSKL